MNAPDPEDTAADGSLRGKLRRVLKEALQLDDLPAGDDLRRRDLEAWDSISHLRLMLTVEQDFGISLDDETFVLADSLGKIEDLLRSQGIDG